MSDPHANQPMVATGQDLETAKWAIVLIHGRDRDPADIIEMTDALPRSGVAYLVPQAKDESWYPNAFQAPIEDNEPGRTSAMGVVGDAIVRANRADISTDRIIVLGFSQGACIAAEFAVHNPERYGGIACLSGGIMGEHAEPGAYAGNLAGTPVLLGSTVDDPYMPEARVHESADVFASLNADVDKRLYPGDDHTINDDERSVVANWIG